MFQASLKADSVETTKRIAGQLAQSLKAIMPLSAPIVLCLDGNLGAGKTTFTTALCLALGVSGEIVSSPTFSLQNVYQFEVADAVQTINHFDFYRINDEDELFETGFEETISKSALHIVEWSSRFPECLPEKKFSIKIVAPSENVRSFEFTSTNEGLADTFNRLQSDCNLA